MAPTLFALFAAQARAQLPSPFPSPSAIPASSAAVLLSPDWFNTNWPVVAAVFTVGIVGIGLAIFMYYTQQRTVRSYLKDLASLRYMLEIGDKSLETPAESVSHKIPIPAALVDAVNNGTCVLFAGHGISRHSTRYTLLNQLIRALELSEADAKEVIAAARTVSIDAGFETLIATAKREQVVAKVAEMRMQWLVSPMSSFEQILGKIPFEDCITTSYDASWMYIFESRRPVQIFGSASDDYEDAAAPGVFSITHVLGSVERPTSIRLTWQELRAYIYANPTFSKYLGSLFQSATVLFLGCSSGMIESVLSSIPELAAQAAGGAQGEVARKHFAVIASDSTLAINSRRFESTYGVTVLPYTHSEGHPQVRDFISQLQELSLRPTSAQLEQSAARPGPPLLKAVRLKNIGPFATIELIFKNNWTTILGDNGSGKSTILRSIAIALASGDPASVAAAKKLRRRNIADEESYIELDLGRQTYHVDLNVAAGGVNLINPQMSPLRRRGLLALGFPALRGASTAVMRGFVPPSATLRPGIPDVLPLVQNEVDWRLDDLRQWLINLNFKASGGSQWSEQASSKAAALRTSFFNILADLSPYEEFSFSRVDSDWNIYVITSDGEVSLDQVSQGMSSLLCWVGTLLQRMYEVYDSSNEPEKEHALVLIDEIDAHLHPAWQRQLPGLLRRHFPNVLFVVTTHSALIVSAISNSDVYVAYRGTEHGTPTLELFDEGRKIGMRADQVLTSFAFGLPSSRGVEHDSDREKLNHLIALDKPTEEQVATLKLLEQKLNTITKSGSWQDTATEAQTARELVAQRVVDDPESMFAFLSTLDADEGLEEEGLKP